MKSMKKQKFRMVPHALLTRSPLRCLPKKTSPFDLHVLSTPPAFVLSQDQTLNLIPLTQQPFLALFFLALFVNPEINLLLEFSLGSFLLLSHTIYLPRCCGYFSQGFPRVNSFLFVPLLRPHRSLSPLKATCLYQQILAAHVKRFYVILKTNFNFPPHK